MKNFSITSNKKVMSKTFLITAIITLGLNPTLYSQDSDCDNVLLAKTVHLLNSEKKSKLAWYNLIDSYNYESKKQEFGAVIPEYFEGDFSEFREKRSKLFTEQKYYSTKFESRQEVRVELPEEGFDAWIRCKEITSNGLSIWIANVDKDGATITVSWNPAPGLSGTLKDVTVNTEGSVESTFNKLSSISEGQMSFELKRSEEDGIMRGNINGIIKNASYSDKYYIPSTTVGKIEIIDRNNNGIDDSKDENRIFLYDGGEKDKDKFTSQIIRIDISSGDFSGCISLHPNFYDRTSFIEWDLPTKMVVTFYHNDGCGSEGGAICFTIDTGIDDMVKGKQDFIYKCNDEISSIKWEKY